MNQSDSEAASEPVNNLKKKICESVNGQQSALRSPPSYMYVHTQY